MSLAALKSLACSQVPAWPSHSLSTWLQSASALQTEARNAAASASSTEEVQRAYVLLFRLCNVWDVVSAHSPVSVKTADVAQAISLTREMEARLLAGSSITNSNGIANSIADSITDSTADSITDSNGNNNSNNNNKVSFEDAFPSLQQLEDAMPISSLPSNAARSISESAKKTHRKTVVLPDQEYQKERVDYQADMYRAQMTAYPLQRDTYKSQPVAYSQPTVYSSQLATYQPQPDIYKSQQQPTTFQSQSHPITYPSQPTYSSQPTYTQYPLASASSSGLARPIYSTSPAAATNHNKLSVYNGTVPPIQPLARPSPARHSSDLFRPSVTPSPSTSLVLDSSTIQYPAITLPPNAANKTTPRTIPTSNVERSTKRLRDSQIHYWANDRIGLSGLKNLGNTCYMNSTLQCLSATAPFARYFRSGQWINEVNKRNTLGTRGCLAKAFAEIITVLWKEEYQFISPLSFRKAICSFAPQFDGEDQHDAQEFLSFLLDGLHEDLNRNISKAPEESKSDEARRENELETLPLAVAAEKEWARWKLRNDSLCVDWFQGQFRNRMECLSCHKTSTTFNTFMYLSLPIPSKTFQPKVSLTHCLDLFCKEETMDKDNAWYCPACQQPRKATKKLSLSRLPPVLMIHLKRFSFKSSDRGDKVDTTVTYPLKGLDLTDYIPSTAYRYNGGGSDSSEDPSAQIPPYRYDLYAVTEHHGNLSSGHYTAHILSSKGWQYAADSKIETVHNESNVKSKEAYVLYYKRVKPDK